MRLKASPVAVSTGCPVAVAVKVWATYRIGVEEVLGFALRVERPATNVSRIGATTNARTGATTNALSVPRPARDAVTVGVEPCAEFRVGVKELLGCFLRFENGARHTDGSCSVTGDLRDLPAVGLGGVPIEP